MSKYRQAAKIDSNQTEIVKQLRQLGATVETGHDDILVGFRGKTYWYEIKTPDTLKKDGSFRKKKVKDSQIKLMETWRGHYRIVTALQEIINEITKK